MPTAKDNGGPAFPFITKNEFQPDSFGMTLRDWFAGQELATGNHPVEHGVRYASDAARECYEVADAMLAERTK